jgi:hypothetical protein
MTASFAPLQRCVEPTTSASQRSIEVSFARLLSALEKLLALEESAIDVGFTIEQLREALAYLFIAQRGDEDPASALPVVVNALDRCIATTALLRGVEPALAPLEADLREARQAAAHGADQARTSHYPGPQTSERLVASVDVLRVHARFQPVLLPAEPPGADAPPQPAGEETPPPAAEPANPDELAVALAALAERAAARKAPAKASPAAPEEPNTEEPPPALALADWRSIRARECLAEVAMLLSHRTPQLGESWRSVHSFEPRILANVDAIVGLGRDATQSLEAAVVGAPAPDILGAAALALTCGAVDGRDSLGFAEWVYRRVEPSAELDAAYFDALALTSHPSLAQYCERLLDDEPSAPRRAHALRLLGRTGRAHAGHVLRGLADAPEVQAEALLLHALAHSPDLRERVDDALALDHDVLTVAAWKAMLIGGDPRANPYLRDALNGRLRDDAGLLLAVAAEQRDAEYLLEQVAIEPTPSLIAALGFAGLTGGVPLLIGLLGVDDFAFKISAARALIRITGWELYEPVELPAEMVGEEAPEAPGERLADELGDPRDPAPEGSPDTVELPTLRQEPWQEHWSAHSGSFDPSLRWRRGQPSSPEVILDDLEHSRATPDERVACVLEVGVRSGLPRFFDTRSWVTTQLRALTAWRSAVAGVGTPGAWIAPRRRA